MVFYLYQTEMAYPGISSVAFEQRVAKAISLCTSKVSQKGNSAPLWCSRAQVLLVLLRSHTSSAWEWMQTSVKVCMVVGIWSAMARTLGSLLYKISCLVRFWLISYFPWRHKPNDDPQTLTKTPVVFEPSRMADGSALPHLNFRPLWAQKTQKNPVKF